MAYATSQFYRHFTILKKNGKTRDIYEPLPDLKYVQTWILENILENPYYLWYTVACETGYGIWPYYPGS